MVNGVLKRVNETVDRGEKAAKEAKELIKFAKRANIDVADLETEFELSMVRLKELKSAANEEAEKQSGSN